MAEEKQEPTAEAKKQRHKREKEAEKNAALGVEKFTVEVAGVFKPDFKRLMKEHGINNQQESEPAAQCDRRRLRNGGANASLCHDTLCSKRKGVMRIS